jgi:ABC-type antimicrobial peptide transport system permease subunit
VNRAKEIGVRKVLGSNRPQLLGQFMQETALITFVSLILACIIAELSLPSIGKLMDRTFSLQLLESPWTLVFLIGIGLIVTFLAGFYPGMVLSGFDPVTAFRSKIAAKSTKGISLRRGLVVTQFVIAQLLIIGTLVVVQQMSYFRNRPMGFERKTILMYDVPQDSISQKSLPILKAKMDQLPGVLASSLCDNPPSTSDAWNTGFVYDTHTEPEGYQITMRFQDTDYLKVFHMQMAAGRQPYPADSIGEVMVNETTVKRLGLRSDQDILGRTIKFSRHGQRFNIVGVMKDFNNKPLNGTVGITPVLVSPSRGHGFNFLSVRFDPSTLEALMPKMAAVYNEVFPNHVPEPTFYDSMLMDNYQAENRAQKLFQIFASLAIFISCLGLYGLVSFMAVQKFKEVGIRKVLGASVGNIIYMFSKEFTVLVAVAFLVAAPLGYYFMKLWLDGFYYRIHIGWGVFLIAIVLSVLIAWITVGYKAIRAALSNPIKALKYE